MTAKLNFASDNVGPAAPQIMAALTRANEAPHMPYGKDMFTTRAEGLVREQFEAPEASIHLVSTGTAANALALSVMARPFDAILCEAMAHIEVDECGAPEFFTGGAKLRRIKGEAAKITPDGLKAAIAELPEGDVHSVQRGPVSITQLTELGTAYAPSEVAALATLSADHGMAVHMDGARFANAMAASTASPAEMTWKAGVDALSLGGTKNGCLGVEAVVFFDPAKVWELSLRRKRAGHLWSKGKYLGAQMAAYLEDGLWLDLAAQANAAMALLLDGLKSIPEARLIAPPAGNLAFIALPKDIHDRAHAAGAQYYLFDAHPDGTQTARIVCDWSKTPEGIAALLALWKG